MRHFGNDTLCRKGTASGKAKVFEGIPAGGGRALRDSENITKLAVELGVSRRQLYRWRDEPDPDEAVVGKPPVKNSRASTLRKEVNHLKRVLAEKTLEVDFFKKSLAKSQGVP